MDSNTLPSGQMDKSGPSMSNLKTQPFVAGTAAILINRDKQKGNPMIKYIRNCSYQFESGIHVDFDVGNGAGALFLSLKYHKLNPDYILKRFDEVGKRYKLRILLVVNDVDSAQMQMRVLNRLCVQNDFTLIVAFSLEEAAEYIESYKLMENKGASTFEALEVEHRKIDSNIPELLWSKASTETEKVEYRNKLDQAVVVLTAVRGVNRTDAQRLLAEFGSISNIARSSIDRLVACQGIGEAKGKRLHAMFRKPLLSILKPKKGLKDDGMSVSSTTSTTSLDADEDTPMF